MQYVPRNTTDKPITMGAIGVTVPAKSRFNRPLTFDELERVNTCGTSYEGIVLEPVLMEEAGSSGPAKENAGSSGPAYSEESALPKRGRKRTFEAE